MWLRVLTPGFLYVSRVQFEGAVIQGAHPPIGVPSVKANYKAFDHLSSSQRISEILAAADAAYEERSYCVRVRSAESRH